MTVDYMRDISAVRPFAYVHVLWRWRGSITKNIITEFFCWYLLFNVVGLFYRIVLFGTKYGSMFEDFVSQVDDFMSTYGSILNFVATFYLSYISTRWAWMFSQIPYPDDFCMLVSALMKNIGAANRTKERQIRLAICRYWNLSFVLLLRDISILAHKRYPNLESLSPSMATSEEISLLRQADDILSSDFQQTCLYSLPLDWIQKIIKQAAEEGNFLRAHLVILHEEIVRTRQKMYDLLAQNFICTVPISLTQLAISIPFIYFFLALFGKQYVIVHGSSNVSSTDWGLKYRWLMAVPFNTIYEFLIYAGWMKAAIAMLNPFGLDDDDFEVDYLIDRNSLYTRVLLDDLFDITPKTQERIFKLAPKPNNLAWMAKKSNMQADKVKEDKKKLSATKRMLAMARHSLKKRATFLKPLRFARKPKKPSTPDSQNLSANINTPPKI